MSVVGEMLVPLQHALLASRLSAGTPLPLAQHLPLPVDVRCAVRRDDRAHDLGARPPMMGSSHAISGAAAWIAVTSTAIPALSLSPLPAESVLFGAVIAAGAALLPDADHHSATIAHSVPVAGRIAAGAIGALSGGHRKGMHSLLAVLGIIAATLALGSVQWTPDGWDRALQIGSACAVAACSAFAVKTLKFVTSWMVAWAVGVLMAGAVLLWAPDQFGWLPICIGVGYLTHLIGDILTVQGVPLLWPLRLRSPRWIRRTPLRAIWLSGGAFAVPLLGSSGSLRERVLAVALTAYAGWGAIAALVELVSSAR